MGKSIWVMYKEAFNQLPDPHDYRTGFRMKIPVPGRVSPDMLANELYMQIGPEYDPDQPFDFVFEVKETQLGKIWILELS